MKTLSLCLLLFASLCTAGEIEDLQTTCLSKGEDAASACYKLGEKYFTGEGVEKSEDQGVEWLKKGCELKNATSCLAAGAILFTKGTPESGGEKNSELRKEGIQYANLGCEYGSGEACAFLGGVYLGDKEGDLPEGNAGEYLEKACNLKVGASCYLLGFFAGLGSIEKPELYEKAIQYMEKGCEYKNGGACLALGNAYKTGEHGIEKSLDKARDYFAKGCEYGEKDACKAAEEIKE